MDKGSEEYVEKEREAKEFLCSATREYILSARERAVKGKVQVGTPLLHGRFLRRARGTDG